MSKKNYRKMHTGRRARHNRRLVILAGIAAGSAMLLVLGLMAWLIITTRKEETAQADNPIQEELVLEETLVQEEEKNSEYINVNTINAIVAGGRTVSEALGKRPATVEMTADNTATFASIDSCLIVDSGKVEVSVTSDGIPRSDDKYYYLFEEATYEDGITEGKEPVAKVYKSDAVSFTVDLNKGKSNSRLFSKFQVAVKKDDQFVSSGTNSGTSSIRSVRK